MSAEEAVLRAVLTYLARRLGPRAVLRGVRVDAVGADGLRQEIRIKPSSLGVAGEVSGDGEDTPIRRAILEVLAEAEMPLKGAAIARRAGRSYSGTFRGALASLVREGQLELGTDGYSLSEADGRGEAEDS